MPFTFLNIALIGGVLAFNIPVLIHLFNRSRFKVVKWGAMHLLEPVIRKNRKRIQIEQIILLLVRAAIPCLIALAMARPVLTGWRALAGQSKTSMVLVMDNSYSMEAGGVTQSNFAQAQQHAMAIVRDLPRGSELMVLNMGGGVTPLGDAPSFNITRLGEELSKQSAGYGAADVPAAVDAARLILADMRLAKRDLVIVSDFQRVSWDTPEAEARQRALAAVNELPIKPSVTFLMVGKPVRDNVAVDALEFSRATLGVRQPLAIDATIHNYGDAAYPDILVRLKVDGEVRGEPQTLNLPPGEQAQVHFNATFDTAGSHVIEVFLEADALRADNTLLAAIPVWDRLPVLLVDGAPSAEPLKGETDFLRIALQPYMAGKVPLADLIDSKVISPEQLDEKAMAESRVVVLANVSQLSDAQLSALETWVRQGGSVIIAPGDRVNSAWYNARLYADGKGLLPARMTSLGGSLDAEAAPARIVQQHAEHKAMAFFNDPRNGNLSDADIKVWYKLDDRTVVSLPDAALIVAARMDNGDPFLMEKKYGQGTVLLTSVPLDADWSNLPVRPFFLPLVQQLVTYAASKVYPSRNVEVGQSLAAFLDPSAADKPATLTDPQGNRVELTPVLRGAQAVVEYTSTRLPGLYVLEPAGKDTAPVHFVVSTSRRESDLNLLTEDQVRAMAQPLGAQVASSLEQYHQLDKQRRFGRETWRWLFAAALGLLFAELLLQQYFTRKRV
ncbi:MAG: BatA domain-containing protein [Phycisphaeraceae bacterium]